jgi:hypothetical protein
MLMTTPRMSATHLLKAGLLLGVVGGALLSTSPAHAARKPTMLERRDIKAAALRECRRSPDARHCRFFSARVSTLDPRYALSSAGDDSAGRTGIAKRPTRHSRRWRVTFVQGGGEVACADWFKVAPRKVVADLGLRGILDLNEPTVSGRCASSAVVRVITFGPGCSDGCLVGRPSSWLPDRQPRLGTGLAFDHIQWHNFGASEASATADVEGCTGPAPCMSWTGTAHFRVYQPGARLEAPFGRVYRCLQITSSTGTELASLIGDTTMIVSGNADENADLCA